MSISLKPVTGNTIIQTSGTFTVDLADNITNRFSYRYISATCGESEPKEIRITKTYPFLGIAKLKDTSIAAGAPVELGKGLVFGSGDFLWSNNLNGETESGLGAIVNPIKSTTYYLAISADGCFYYDTLNVLVKGTIAMPNMFSPNGNGKNESFGIPVKFSVNSAIELVIVNKFGQTVFAKSGEGIRWYGIMDNGKEAPQDTYYYRIKFRDEGDELTGFVQLVR
jgi:gliding motility-associated-like protein